MATGPTVFEEAVSWLMETYDTHHFFQERDVVWTVHLYLLRTVEERHLPHRIYSSHRMRPDKQVSADLAIIDTDGIVDVAAEFKFEPDHRRTDLWAPNAKRKVPVVEWQYVEADVVRTRGFVFEGWARTAYAVFIDEGSCYRWRTPPAGSEWREWPTAEAIHRPISVLWAQTTRDTHAAEAHIDPITPTSGDRTLSGKGFGHVESQRRKPL